MKKHLFWKIILVILLISVISFTSPYYIKSSQENTLVKKYIETPLTLLGIEVETIDQDANHPVIEAAFGLKVGEKFDINRAINTLQLSSGTTLYEIQPILTHSSIGRYYVTTNTEDQTIESVRGIAYFDSKDDVNKEVESLNSIVKQKFTLVHNARNEKYYKDEKGNLLLLFLKPVGAGYELVILCLCPR